MEDPYRAFFEALRAKLEQGARDYGDASFTRPTAEILGELQAEALDLAGWGFILWERIERLRVRSLQEPGLTSPVAAAVFNKDPALQEQLDEAAAMSVRAAFR